MGVLFLKSLGAGANGSFISEGMPQVIKSIKKLVLSSLALGRCSWLWEKDTHNQWCCLFGLIFFLFFFHDSNMANALANAICERCRGGFAPAEKIVNSNGELYHEQCFVCAQCFQQFPEGLFYEVNRAECPSRPPPLPCAFIPVPEVAMGRSIA